MELIFATNNKHKIREISALLHDRYRLISPEELGITGDIPEYGRTLEENALHKARVIFEKCGKDVFADDTGLEVESLGGAPGVHSARYAGEEKNSTANIAKLLQQLAGVHNRKARFRTVIALIMNRKEYLFEGTVSGGIIETARGTEGFGYDPVFVPQGYSKTFAELPLSEKNAISHRSEAFRKLLHFLTDKR